MIAPEHPDAEPVPSSALPSTALHLPTADLPTADPAGVDPAGDYAADGTEVAPADLPEQVRARIVDLAARTLAGLPPASVPAALARVARFTPAKRAKLAGAALAQTVAEDTAFRAAVTETARLVHSSTGSPGHPADADDASMAAHAYLLRLPEAGELIERVAEAGRVDGLRGRIADQERELMRLRSRLDSVTAERDQMRAELDRATPGAAGELDKLRGRLREQGTRVKAAELAAAAAAASAEAALAQVTADLDRAQRGSAEWQERYTAANERAEANARALSAERDAAGSTRAAADRRLDLLLGTVEGAVAGLRRELRLAGGGATPADLVAAGLPAAGAGRERAADPARLTEWLALPNAHLIVDGYNVTKTAYPQLSLADQRDRLIRGLSGLSSRTSAEITVVFDGAKVTTAQPAGRGIRVLFSPPGVIADDIIRRLVGQEPPGRVVIVASSDREVATSVVRAGARSVGSPVLADLLGSAGR